MSQSMNQNSKMSKKAKIIIGVVVLAVAAGGFIYYRSTKKETVTYRRVEAKKGDLEITILATGTVQPENRLEIKAPVAGRMESVLVKEGQKLVKGQVIAWMSSSERAAMLDAARSKGAEEYKRWSELYLATPIMAPISGTLILRSVEPGQTFTNTDAIFTMSDRLTVKAQVDETDISQIKLKEKAQIVLDAYPGQKIDATVDQIAFDAKTVNSVTTYIVDVLPQKAPPTMLSGMTANVTFFIESKKDVLLIPSESIKVQDGRTLVMVAGPDGKPQQRDVSVGSTDGRNTEVTDGVSEGETVMIAEVKLSRDGKKGSNPFSPMGGARPPRR
ncbi:efflux RND transporter periplasmic adaptor subunit [Bdellovibrio sp. NC01]|uniref:efflux RND transporter periplasmic adaptor subunit n=1 Tax=Bdellovibrio sp. NC01 TaxID=2220073 RepID=UPI001FEFC859|nr:efflux RND transporter periplasmic adaptor subunit [Bdellovibrio sp. NC01]